MIFTDSLLRMPYERETAESETAEKEYAKKHFKSLTEEELLLSVEALLVFRVSKERMAGKLYLSLEEVERLIRKLKLRKVLHSYMLPKPDF